MTLGSTELYDLDTKCVPDVLGLHARGPEAAVVKVMSGRGSQCVRVLIPDDNVGFQGFHDVLLFDMADVDDHMLLRVTCQPSDSSGRS